MGITARSRFGSVHRSLLAVATVLALTVGVATQAGAAPNPGFLTSEDSMLTPLAAGSSVQPIITVGDTLQSGYMFEAIPDGISMIVNGKGSAQVFVNHETSTVPFPYNAASPDVTNSQNDFDNAQLSRLVLSQKNGGVLAGKFVIPSSANYQRFCSNYLIGPAEGFEEPLLITNEEATDFVNRTGTAWPAGPDAEQAGVAVAYDPATGAYRTIYGLGRLNHENTMPVPGYGEAVLLTGDDTFSAPSSQLYMYRAADRDAVWNDEGHLWAFVSDDPDTNDYGDLAVGESVSGHFIEVPDEIADGEQTPLENWSNENNVFQFIRIEDTAYDRNTPNVVYLADTGEPRAIPSTTTTRLTRGPSGTMGPYPNGRIFKMVLNESDPTVVDSLSILIDADAGGYNNQNVLHQPDNLETTANSLLVQEDPGSHNQYTAGTGPNSRLWRFDFDTETFVPVAMVDQSADPAARAGAWENSGILDASAAFGPGAFLLDVQAHTLWIDTAPGPDLVAPEGPDWLYKREGGQLLLLWLPGA